ncbi:hypothetical protein HLB23_20525 [Nocardia uniformis]|uniref:HEAT repeat domain-containing protein n=1 Tax=Nocardia uniformis TaxID=53432 RepID=A0A849C0S3_9NOCA|nr:hypothetical protein [Nocardia uniformis]NNH72214.1 hypothetical protein [Nocardia uniformis]
MTQQTGVMLSSRLLRLLGTARTDPNLPRTAMVMPVADTAGLAKISFGSTVPELRAIGVALTSEIVMQWRTEQPELLAELALCVADPDYHSDDAAGVLAAITGTAPAPDFTPVIPTLVEALDHESPFGSLTLALARLRHPTAVDSVRQWLTSGRIKPLPDPFDIEHVLSPLVDYAEELLPAIRASLATESYNSALHPLLRTLAAWGPTAAPALPELLPYLRNGDARWACEALGSIGPDAAPAAELIERYARGTERPPRHDTGLPPDSPHEWHGTQTAAWALWRITGESGVALSVFGDAIEAGIAVDFDRLAEFGSLACLLADDVRARLDSPGRWEQVHAARAWWRITGDAEPAVPVLLNALEPLTSGYADAECRAAVRLISEIGSPMRAAMPLLEAVLSTDRRFGPLPPHRAPQSQTELIAAERDTELCVAAQAALIAIDAG